MNKTKLLEIAQALNLGTIDDEKARTLLLGLLNVSTRTFKVGDNVQWRGMDLIVVEIGVNEILIATSQNVDDEGYNDWWVGTQYVC
jgi:hypothetical protein